MSKAVYQAIAAIRDHVGHVDKDGRHDFLNYNYATETSLSRAIRPLLAEHGLVIIPLGPLPDSCFVDDSGVTHLTMQYDVVHLDTGESIQLSVFASGADPQKEGKHGDKGAYKANTGAYKYLLTRMFMIDTGDDPEVARADERPEHPPTRSSGSSYEGGHDEPPPPTEEQPAPSTPARPPTRKTTTRKKTPTRNSATSAGGVANAGQLKMFKAVSFYRAEKLLEGLEAESEATGYENKFELGLALRNAAIAFHGISSEENIPRSAVNAVKAAIEIGEIESGSDEVFIPSNDEVPF